MIHCQKRIQKKKEGQQQANACLLCGGSCRVDEDIGGEASGEESRVSDLLQGDGVEHQLRASCQDARKLSFEAQAHVERAQPQRSSRKRWGRGREGAVSYT